MKLTCVSCHDPHGTSDYRILKDDPNPGNGYNPIPITSNETTPDFTSIKYKSGQSGWCVDCHTQYLTTQGTRPENNPVTGAQNIGGTYDAGDSYEAVVRYRHGVNKLIRSKIADNLNNNIQLPVDQNTYSSNAQPDDIIQCLTCHQAHGTSAVMTSNTNVSPTNDSALLRLNNRGICQDCHQVTGGGCENGLCHDTTTQTQKTGSHETHFNDDKGPKINSCDVCHGTGASQGFQSGHKNGIVNFTDGSSAALGATSTCNNCHSPLGSYNGVNSISGSVGAKDNWQNGVYESGNLKTGKEKWCAGCHDETPSVIASVSAPDVIGDEDAGTNYGTGYGFYKTGHGLPSNKTYPATGSQGAGIECLNCHDAEMLHADGTARTYTPDSDYLTYDPVSANYQIGFRLKDVSTGYYGKYPMHIPRTGHVYPPGFREDQEFALCFTCHNRDKLFNGGDPITGAGAGTNFRGLSDGSGGGNPAPVIGLYYSLHDVHTWGANGPLGPETPQYDSDFDGIADSRISCPACHNVHGSPSPAMMRHGELISTPGTTDKVPALDFQYTPTGLYPTLVNSTGGNTRFIAPGPGDVSKNGICNMCHNDGTTYTRLPAVIGNPPNVPSNTSPANGATSVSTTPVLGSSAFSDPDIGDTHQASQWQITTTSGNYSSPAYDSGSTIDLTNHIVGTPLAGSTTYYWRVRHQDNKGAWSGYSTETSFATAPGGGPQTLILHPSDVVSTGGFSTTGGSWSNILDSNDGDASYAYYGAGPGGQIFYVNMDDPTGLGSATINNITIYVYARYLAGPWPGAVPYAGSINIGYKTGSTTVWKGSVSTDTSGAYNLIISSAYTTDSDGGSLSLSDINNLQIAVKRNTSGPMQLRATEVYVKIDYTP
jgi:hypothetical protein